MNDRVTTLIGNDPSTAAPDLLDVHTPTYDVAITEHLVVEANAATVFETAVNFDFMTTRSAVVTALMHDVAVDQFAAFAEPGWGKIGCHLLVRPDGPGRSILTCECHRDDRPGIAREDGALLLADPALRRLRPTRSRPHDPRERRSTWLAPAEGSSPCGSQRWPRRRPAAAGRPRTARWAEPPARPTPCSLAYVPIVLAGFLANGGFDKPVADPYLAIMELLIMVLAAPLVMVFACVHAFAIPDRKSLALSAFVLSALTVGITVCVHLVTLTVGRQADASTLPGYDRLLSWTWPSVVFALDIASWDFCFGFALLLAAAVFTGPDLSGCVRRGLELSGGLCLFGLFGAATGNMGVRDVGIAGYAVVLPVVLLVMARLFAATPVVEPLDDHHNTSSIGRAASTHRTASGMRDAEGGSCAIHADPRARISCPPTQWTLVSVPAREQGPMALMRPGAPSVA